MEMDKSSHRTSGPSPHRESVAIGDSASAGPKDTNLNSYQVLRMGDVPEIEVEFLPSTETPVGLGEPATTPVAPAIANGIFAATGARVRHLPIRPQAVLDALARGS